jgi:transcriptional regulator with XRE-family HTH domain
MDYTKVRSCHGLKMAKRRVKMRELKISDSSSNAHILETIGERVQRLRIAQGLTQKVLADRAGIASRTVQNVEAGRPIQLSGLIAISMALGRLSDFDPFLASPDFSPLELKKMAGRRRKRAYAPRPRTKKTATDIGGSGGGKKRNG